MAVEEMEYRFKSTNRRFKEAMKEAVKDAMERDPSFMKPDDDTRLVPRRDPEDALPPMTVISYEEQIESLAANIRRAAVAEHQEKIDRLAASINQRSGIAQWTERDAEDWGLRPDTGCAAIPEMSNIERVARAIVESLGFDPDRAAFRGEPRRVNYDLFLTPNYEEVRPLWTFFTVEADAAIEVLEI